MITKTIDLYEFDELTPDQQARVVENYRDINVDFDDWHAPVLDEWKEKLSGLGFVNAEIHYSGFYSQGDGASFECKVDLLGYMRAHKLIGHNRALAYALAHDEAEADIAIKQSGYYSHEYTMHLDRDLYYYNVSDQRQPKIDAQFDRVTDGLLDCAREYARRIYHDLEAEYEYLTTDEAVIDTIRANEYTFNDDGRIDR